MRLKNIVGLALVILTLPCEAEPHDRADFANRSVPSTTAENPGQSDSVHDSDGYQISISYSSKGTRSEVVQGTISFHGQEILGKVMGDTMKTPSGVYVWYGDPQTRKGWGPSGWLPKDLSTVYPSWQIPDHHPSQK